MASRTDANQRAIVEELRAYGATVHCCHEAAHGFPDLCVGFRGRTYLMEVKAPGGKLTPAQWKWHTTWRGQVDVVRSVDDALRVIGALPRREVSNDNHNNHHHDLQHQRPDGAAPGR